MKKLLLLTAILLLGISANAQKWQKVDSVFAPIGITVKSFSAPAFGDLNGDGSPDLFLGTIEDYATFYYNTGTFINPHYTKDTNVTHPIYKDGYTGTNSNYPVLVDLDGDGDLDLVIGGYNGLLFYRNVGDKTHPVFESDTTVFANINSLIGSDGKPAFADLDGDGDLDLLVGTGESLSGGPESGLTLGFRNIGTKSAPIFAFDSALVVGLPKFSYNSYPALADLDGDGKIDLLLGSDGGSLAYYKNTGSKTNPVWTSTSGVFASVESSTYWKNPILYDIDGDGDLDLIYGTSNGLIYFYQNVGTTTAPKFANVASYFKVVKSSGAATVSFGDFDNNGTLDLLSGSAVGSFQYFANGGSKAQPALASKTGTISLLNPASYTAPVFIDIDGDGDLDIVSGSLGGKLYCYLNNKGSYTENTKIFATVNNNSIYFSAPAFGDINGDGNIDLLVGAETSTDTKFYLNTGNNTFVQNDTMFAGVTFPSNAHPVFVDVDGDGDLDLVMGNGWGDVIYYENTGTKTKPVWTKNETLFAGISVPQNSFPGFADLDGDGRKDFILGEYNGNFAFYKNLFATPVTAVKDKPQAAITSYKLEQNYPNPFNPTTVIRYQIPSNSMVSIKVFDVLGNEVQTLVNEEKSQGSYQVQFNGAGLASGVYFYQLKAGDNVYTKKLMLLK
jgi:large repetitive protein